MNEDRTSVANAALSASARPGVFEETWATRAELAELDQLLTDYADSADRLADSSAQTELANSMSAGLQAFNLLRRLNLRWSDDMHAGRIPFFWDDSRGICSRYRLWHAATLRVLQINRDAGEGPTAAVRGLYADQLRAACFDAKEAVNVNLDDLQVAFDRLASYNRSWRSRPVAAGGGA